MICTEQVFEAKSVTTSARRQTSVDAGHHAGRQHDVRCVTMIHRACATGDIMYDAISHDKNRLVSFDSQFFQHYKEVLYCCYVFVNFASGNDYLLQLDAVLIEIRLYFFSVNFIHIPINNCHTPGDEKQK